jgi:hypothetical protein
MQGQIFTYDTRDVSISSKAFFCEKSPASILAAARAATTRARKTSWTYSGAPNQP